VRPAIPIAEDSSALPRAAETHPEEITRRHSQRQIALNPTKRPYHSTLSFIDESYPYLMIPTSSNLSGRARYLASR
jgi:hypothetical protein